MLLLRLELVLCINRYCPFKQIQTIYIPEYFNAKDSLPLPKSRH